MKESEEEKLDQNMLQAISEALGLKTEMGIKALEMSLINIKLLDKKQQDYGSGNISAFGEFGVLVRLSDKLNRLQNLFKTQAPTNFESVGDTWVDINNYGLIGLMCHKKVWK